MKKVTLCITFVITILLIGCTNVHSSRININNALNLPEEYTFNMAVQNEDVVILHEKIFPFVNTDDFISRLKNTDKVIRITEFLREGGVLIRVFSHSDSKIVYTIDKSRSSGNEDDIVTVTGDEIKVYIEERTNYRDKKDKFYVFKLITMERPEDAIEIVAFPTFQKYKFVIPTSSDDS